MATAPPGPLDASPFAVLAHRDFRYYASGRFLATLGIQMQGLAVGFQVYALTQRKLDLAYVGLVQFLPIISLSIGAGQLADRLDRRRILIACDAVFAVAAVGLYAISRSAMPSSWAIRAILALLCVVGAARAFYGPAGSSLLPSLVPREHFTRAMSWHSTLWQVAAIAGPALGGAIYSFGGPGPVYLTTAILVTCGAALVAGVAARPGRGERPPATLETALAGVRYVRRHKIVLGAITLDFLAVFLGGATALLPVFASSELLDVGPQGLGLMRSAPAIGAGLMAAYLSLRPLGGRAGPKMLAGVAVFGAATVVFGLSRSLPVTVAVLALLGAADMVSVVVRGTLIQAATPPEMRGRVSAVNMMFVGASNELGEFESGALAEWLGPVPSVVIGGAGTLAVVLLWTLGFPELRRVDRLEDVRPEPVPAESPRG